MEGILTEYVGGYGAFLGGLALLILVVGGVLMGRLAEEEGKGKRFFWAEWPLPGTEPRVPGETKTRQVA